MSPDPVVQTKETFEKMSAIATDTFTHLMKDATSAPLQAAREYNSKLLEFALINSNAAFDYAQKLSSVKSPTEFIELMTNQVRKQLEILTDQTKELSAVAGKTMPKSGDLKGFS